MTRLVFAAVAVLVAGGLLLATGCAPQDGPPTQSEDSTRKVLYWRSPMDPTFVTDKPGKDGMGMDLVPVYEGDTDEDPGVVRLDLGTVQTIGVRVAKSTRETIAREVRTVGIVTYDETKVTHVHTKVNGWLQKLYVDFEGQLVRQGEPLISIYSPELVSTQQEYLLALKAQHYLQDSAVEEIAEGADTLLRSTRERLRLFDVKDEHIQELVATGSPSTSLTLHSPFDGFVTEKNALEGMYVTPAMKLYTIADLRTVWVDADVYEYEAPFVHEGQPATVSLAYSPGKVLHGRVTYIYPYLEARTRTLKVRLEFPNPDYLLKPDMYVDVLLQASQPASSIVVPKEALIRTGKRDVVFLNLGEGRFKPREVKLGIETSTQYEILQGLEEGEEVVISAQFLLDSESNLQEAINRMTRGAAPESGTGMADETSKHGEHGDSDDAQPSH